MAEDDPFVQPSTSTASSRVSVTWEVERPPTTLLRAAEQIRLQAKKHAPVRYSFISRETAEQPDPPLARMLRGGRGGGHLRLRVLLTALWLVRDDATLELPLRAWAALAGLDDISVRGTRRVRDALTWLEEKNFLDLDRGPGQTPRVTLRQEDGGGDPYVLPGAAYNRTRADPHTAAAHRYVRLPRELWTRGWMGVLSGSALAVLLVLYRELGPRVGQGRAIWLSPQLADDRYALSTDTRTKGQRELRDAGLLQITRRPVSENLLNPERMRNVLEYDENALIGKQAELHRFTTRT